MTVVRELTTVLGFTVDKRGVEDFNRTIIGFKTKFANCDFDIINGMLLINVSTILFKEEMVCWMSNGGGSYSIKFNRREEQFP